MRSCCNDRARHRSRTCSVIDSPVATPTHQPTHLPTDPPIHLSIQPRTVLFLSHPPIHRRPTHNPRLTRPVAHTLATPLCGNQLPKHRHAIRESGTQTGQASRLNSDCIDGCTQIRLKNTSQNGKECTNNFLARGVSLAWWSEGDQAGQITGKWNKCRKYALLRSAEASDVDRNQIVSSLLSYG